jgi:hypothetical protein
MTTRSQAKGNEGDQKVSTEIVIVFLRGGFLTRPDSAGSMAQRDNRRLDCTTPYSGALRRCPVQPSTPLGPDQVNVLLLFPPNQYPRDQYPRRNLRRVRAELEACGLWSVQGKWARLWLKRTLPKPGS